ncbi:MAG: hypothetical protein ABI899_12875, partial [Actinomycetota bacterium]
TTTSIEHHAKTPDASRHHRGTPGRRTKARRAGVRARAPVPAAIDDRDSALREVPTFSESTRILGDS